MKKTLVFFTTILISCLAFAQGLTGYDIMKKSDSMNEPKTSSQTATMTLLDKKGNSRIRQVIMKSKDFSSVKKEVIVFTTPKDVSGIGYLVFNYEENADGSKKDSESWLWMPASKKVRRISSSEGGGSFMGTDFTYDDMGDRGLNKDTFNLKGEESLDGVNCYVVECLAKDQTEKNPRKICWIGKDNFMLYKAEFYDRQNNKARELVCSGIEEKNGYWTTSVMFMKNVQTNHSTKIEMKETVFDQPIEDSLFTVAALEKGRIR
ncbi:MAG: outer membrane lipoprotein-sorting protein [Treponemataceae bacterium]|nr:outer membrane lipoprotein-sorting protein [Treponemataceae bacterium]